MNADTAAIERIKTAIGGQTHATGGKPRYVEVAAVDVLAIAGAVTTHTPATTALQLGAEGALAGEPESKRPQILVVQQAHELAELLEKAGVPSDALRETPRVAPAGDRGQRGGKRDVPPGG